MVTVFFSLGVTTANAEQNLMPRDLPVLNHLPKYDITIEFVSPERLRTLSRLFGRTDQVEGLSAWRNGPDGKPLGNCTVYLTGGATYDTLAHEMRHCFEGRFHRGKNNTGDAKKALPKPGHARAGLPWR